MKSRSEVLKSRSEAVATKKSSTAERTIPLPNVLEVTCKACEEAMPITKLEKRSDGTYECLHCAAPIFADDSADEDVERKAIQEEAKSSTANAARSGAFCGECGAEWPLIKGLPSINCGHMKAKRVSSSAEASKPKPVTASGVASKPASKPTADAGGDLVPASTTTAKIPQMPQVVPTISLVNNRLSITWGKTIFPVGEPRGFKFSNMDVGANIITRDVQPGEDWREVATTIIADLQWITEQSFNAQYAWYKQKLGIIDK